MLGAYSSYMLQNHLGLPFVLCVPASFVIVALVGLVLERGLIRYLYKRPLDTLLATFGVSLVLMQGVRLIFGSDPKYLAVPSFFSSNFQLGFVNISVFRLVVLGVTMALVVALWALFYRTRFGVQVRAVMQNKEMAASFGINSDRIYMLTFALGAGLAGIAGSLFGVLNIVLPTMGAGWQRGCRRCHRRTAIHLRLFLQRHLRSLHPVRADRRVPANSPARTFRAIRNATLAPTCWTRGRKPK
jgi:urea transport system permease protein